MTPHKGRVIHCERNIFVCLFFWFFSAHTYGACSASASVSPALMNYGTHASQNIPAGGISPNGTAVDGTFNVSCSLALTISLLGTTSWLRYTPQLPLQLSNGKDTINYIIGSSSSFTPSATAPGQSVGGPVGFSLITLAILTSGSINLPLHIATSATSFWPSAGTYTGSQTLLVDGVMCTGIGLPGVCIGTSPVNSNVAMSMKLEVSKSCEFITSPTLVDFGAMSFLDNAAQATLTSVLRCTHLEDYLLYADNGNHYSGGFRRMTNVNGHSISYEILQPNTTNIGLNISSPLSRVGTGLTESIVMPVKIVANQSTPPAAIYSDNVRIVIEY